MADAWRVAFEAVRNETDFGPLAKLLGSADAAATVNAMLEWDGASATPLFVAVLLGLVDQIPELLALGADVALQCPFEGALCCPVHVAAIKADSGALRALLDGECDPNELCAEASGYSALNPLHLLIVRDFFDEGIYRLLLSRGAKITSVCKDADGAEVCGLVLPKCVSLSAVTPEKLDSVIGEEVKHTIRTRRFANATNTFLELSPLLKTEGVGASYRFVKDIDFRFPASSVEAGIPSLDDETTTMLNYAADVGNFEAMRLLLYSGSDVSLTTRKSLEYMPGQEMVIEACALHMAGLREDLKTLETLVTFGVDPTRPCRALVRATGTTNQPNDLMTSSERWEGLTLVHLAVLIGCPTLISHLIKLECEVNAVAYRHIDKGEGQEPLAVAVTPLLLAVMRADVRCTSALLDLGAADPAAKSLALETPAVCEMFGGPAVVTLEDWLSALLKGQNCVQDLLDRRTDLTRAFDWNPVALAGVFGSLHLEGAEIPQRLGRALADAPTALQGVRPVHLACLLEQPWALEMFVAAGVTVDATPPCVEVPIDAPPSDNPALASVPLDALFLCARTGELRMLELLSREPEFALSVGKELDLVPDLTPPFYPRKSQEGDDYSICWAWQRLTPLELAVLHKRVDVAVLLVRLGANLLHTVDHVSIRPPGHYSISNFCFRGLNALHLCALLDNRMAATALLNEAGDDRGPVRPDEKTRPRRQELLSGTCTQVPTHVGAEPGSKDEVWLWRDVTPIHLAILMRNLDVAELLIEMASPATLEKQCFVHDVPGESEKSMSALFLAYDNNLQQLHRKIAKKFPIC
jgi:ankyrin repeat protein